MAKKLNKAQKALKTLKGRRYSMPAVADMALLYHGVETSRASLCRIHSGERAASDELEQALIALVELMR